MIRIRLFSATLATFAALLLLVPAGGVVAQTPPPIERTPAMEQQAAEMADLFPDTLLGVSLVESLDINVGQELLSELDPSNPQDAKDIAQIHELAAAAGATVDDSATATSYAQLDEDTYAYVVAYRVRGADVQPTVPLFVAAFQEDIPDATVEQTQIGGEDVTLLASPENPDAAPIAILARGDVLWMVIVPQESLEEAIGSLPQT